VTTDQPEPGGLTDEEREQLLRAAAQLAADVQVHMQALVQAFLPTVQAVAAQFAELQRHLQRVGLLDADGKPTRAINRPAWQSPYGPPRTRH
jgi:hypothetical protein